MLLDIQKIPEHAQEPPESLTFINIPPVCDWRFLTYITEKAILTVNAPLYAAIVSKGTGDIRKAMGAHGFIMDEVFYVLFLDYYYETGNNICLNHATEHHSRLLSGLIQEQANILLPIEHKLFSFWDVEHSLSVRFIDGAEISQHDLEEFTLRKSTDVYLYSNVAGTFTPFPVTVATELYHHQLMRDFYDDVEDLLEDFNRKMPNSLLMRLRRINKLGIEKEYSQEELNALVRANGVYAEQMRFVENYVQVKQVSLPEGYEWVRDCSSPKRDFIWRRA